METSRKSLNLRKLRLLEYIKHHNVEESKEVPRPLKICEVETSTEDLPGNDEDPPLNPIIQELKEEIDERVDKIEQWEKVKDKWFEKLLILIERIRIKQAEIQVKEIEFLQTMKTKQVDVQIKEGIPASVTTVTDDTDAASDDHVSKTSQKRKLKRSIDHFHKTQRMKLDTSDDEELVPIGPNGTKVPKSILKVIDWKSTTSATRALLMAIFDRKTLAFHTLTGKRSPAFVDCNLPVKDQLDPLKVADIIHMVTKKCNVPERDVKMAITTKCADENKMYKQREKRQSMQKKTQNM